MSLGSLVGLNSTVASPIAPSDVSLAPCCFDLSSRSKPRGTLTTSATGSSQNAGGTNESYSSLKQLHEAFSPDDDLKVRAVR